MNSCEQDNLLGRLELVRQTGQAVFMARCPAHDDRTPSLHIKHAGDRVLLKCFAGCTVDSILSALGLHWRDLFEQRAPSQPHGLAQPARRFARSESAPKDGTRRRLERVWSAATPLVAGDEATIYLAHRGLRLSHAWPTVLRFTPSLPYFVPSQRTPWLMPAMLAKVESAAGELVALHRTYLARDGRGKANVDAPKKLTQAVFTGATRGAAVRLFAATSRLAVAEGIETALAVAENTGWPTWATVSAGGMAALDVPETVEQLLIAADHDRAGQDAARALALRFERTGRQASIAIPPTPGFDWLDELNQEEAA